MASHLQHLLPLILFLLPSVYSATYLLPIFKTTDHARPQYHTNLQIGTPPVNVTLSIDVNNAYTWLACDAIGYNRSSTYTPIHCNTPDCDSYSGVLAACIDCSKSPTPSCNLNQCASLGSNPVTNSAFLGPILTDSATLYRRNNPSSNLTVTTLQKLPISCVNAADLKSLSQYTNGILTLARAPIAVEYSVSSTFNVPRKFAVCLPSSASGAVYFGGGPYFLSPSNADISRTMISVPLVVNGNSSKAKFDLGDPSIMYYIKVNAIEIDGSPVGFNSSLLSFDGNGNGGTMVSTITPYGKLQSEIYKAFVELFTAKAKAKNVKMVGSARKEFGACFDSKSIVYDIKTGSGLPVIELVLEGGKRWRIFGSNSVVKVKNDTWCLAFVDAGKTSSTGVTPAVVIGGVQMEDNLVEFDLEGSNLGVTSSLLTLGTSCSQFNGL